MRMKELLLSRTAHEKEFKKRWAASQMANMARAESEFKESFPSQSNHAGLGLIKRIVDLPLKLKWKLLISLALEMEEKWLIHAQSLSQQGVWTK